MNHKTIITSLTNEVSSLLFIWVSNRMLMGLPSGWIIQTYMTGSKFTFFQVAPYMFSNSDWIVQTYTCFIVTAQWDTMPRFNMNTHSDPLNWLQASHSLLYPMPKPGRVRTSTISSCVLLWCGCGLNPRPSAHWGDTLSLDLGGDSRYIRGRHCKSATYTDTITRFNNREPLLVSTVCTVYDRW